MTAPQLERLKVEVELKRAALIEARAELFKLQVELEAFLADYDRIVGPIEAQIDAIRAADEARTRQQSESVWGAGYASFEDYLKRHDAAAGQMIQPESPAPDPDALRTLYRRLARRFHPDTSTDPAEQARLSQIMSAINAAYRQKDHAALQRFDNSPNGEVASPAAMEAMPITRAKPPETLAEWQETARQIDDEIRMVREEIRDLRDSQIMALKIDYALGKTWGRNTLREIATEKQRELDALQKRKWR